MPFTPTPPIKIKRVPGGFSVFDGNGVSLAYIYSRPTANEARHANVLTEAQAEEVAKIIARALRDMG